jgi:hypothetical protein
MHSEGLNALLVAAPLLLILVAVMLRVDDHLFTSEARKKNPNARPKFSVTDKDGETVLTDPDGRPFGGEASPGKTPRS